MQPMEDAATGCSLRYFHVGELFDVSSVAAAPGAETPHLATGTVTAACRNALRESALEARCASAYDS